MCNLRELVIKHEIVFIKGRGVKVLLAQDDPIINVMQYMVICIQFMEEATIIIKNIPCFLTMPSGGLGLN